VTWRALGVEIAVEFQKLAERRDDVALATDEVVKARKSFVGVSRFTRATTRPKKELGALATCALAECSARFVALRDGKYCGKRCRDRARRRMEPERRRCDHPLCQNVFVAHRYSHRFCGTACSVSAARAKRGVVAKRAPKSRGPQLPKPYPRVKQFEQRRAKIPVVESFTGFAKGNATKRAKQLRQRPPIVCANPTCAASFVPNYSNARYCADVCQREHYAQKQRAKRRRRWQVAQERGIRAVVLRPEDQEREAPSVA